MLPVNSLEELESALKAYFEGVQLQKSPNPPALMPLILRLDEAGRLAYDDSPPMLQHYLERKSYEKALKFLQGELEDHRP